MVVSYDYIAGGTVVFEVSEDWARRINALDVEERNNDRRETRRHIYLSTIPETDSRLAINEPNPEFVVCEADSLKRLLKRLRWLTERQKEVVAMRLAGLSNREISRRINISHASVERILLRVSKILLPFVRKEVDSGNTADGNKYKR